MVNDATVVTQTYLHSVDCHGIDKFDASAVTLVDLT
jgi:hypothetical protein